MNNNIGDSTMFVITGELIHKIRTDVNCGEKEAISILKQAQEELKHLSEGDDGYNETETICNSLGIELHELHTS